MGCPSHSERERLETSFIAIITIITYTLVAKVSFLLSVCWVKWLQYSTSPELSLQWDGMGCPLNLMGKMATKKEVFA